MPKKHINLTEAVMDELHDKNVQMRPKAYFVLASVLLFVSLVLLLVSSAFMISLIRFSLKAHGPMADIRFELLLSTFPWWAPILAIGSFVGGIFLFRRYDISYKYNSPILILAFLAAVLVAGWSVEYLGLENRLFHQGPMRGIMRRYEPNRIMQRKDFQNRNQRMIR